MDGSAIVSTDSCWAMSSPRIQAWSGSVIRVARKVTVVGPRIGRARELDDARAQSLFTTYHDAESREGGRTGNASVRRVR